MCYTRDQMEFIEAQTQYGKDGSALGRSIFRYRLSDGREASLAVCADFWETDPRIKASFSTREWLHEVGKLWLEIQSCQKGLDITSDCWPLDSSGHYELEHHPDWNHLVGWRPDGANPNKMRG